MRILAIESSAVTASVAILTDDTLTAEYTINYKKTHSQTLLPMIDEICDMTDVKPDEFDVVAVSTGPGSFTGLRSLNLVLCARLQTDLVSVCMSFVQMRSVMRYLFRRIPLPS